MSISNEQKIIAKAFKYFRKNKKFLIRFLGCNLLLLLYSASSVLYPYLLSQVIDQGIVKGNYIKLCIYILNTIFVSAVMAVTYYLKTVKFAKLGQDFSVEMKENVFNVFKYYDECFFEEYKNGEILSTIENDIGKVRDLLTTTLSNFGVNILTILGMLIIFFTLNKAILIGILILLVGYTVYQSHNGRIIKKEALSVSKKRGDVYSNTEELVNNYLDARSMNAISFLFNKYHICNKEYNYKELSLIKHQQMAVIGGIVVQALGIAGVLFYGAELISKGTMGIGALFSMVIYCQRIFSPILSLSSDYAQLKNVMASLERINQLLNGKRVSCNSREQINFRESPAIRFKGLTFGRGKTRLVNNVNIDIERGDKLAILGENGSGKSTFVKIILREKNDYEGKVYFYNSDLAGINVEDIRKNILYVPQNNLIFEDTLQNNILLGRSIKIDKSLEEILELVGLQKDVKSWNNGLNTILGTKGVMLSGGQRKKIALARAFVQFPRILILDEPTADLDLKSEEHICNSIYEIFKNQIVIVITHRKKILEKCNRILEIENKTIHIVE